MSALLGERIRVLEDPAAVCQYAADVALKQLRYQPNSNLWLITGGSPLITYDIFRSESASIFDRAKICNPDEYCVPDGPDDYKMINPDDPISFRRVMREQLPMFEPGVTSFFPGIENYRHPGRYDQFLKRLGGIQLAINGFGPDGHTAGFSMPGTPFNSVTSLVELSEDTRQVNSKKTSAVTPRHAISTGPRTLMQVAEKVITIGFGADKAQAVYDAATQPRSRNYPLTVLRRHLDHELVIDEAAAQLLPVRYNRTRGSVA